MFAQFHTTELIIIIIITAYDVNFDIDLGNRPISQRDVCFKVPNLHIMKHWIIVPL